MNRAFIDGAAGAFRSFASKYGGQYDVRDRDSPRLRFSHPVVGEALIRCSLVTRFPYPSWVFAWWEDDFDNGRRRLMGGIRRSSGHPALADGELAVMMCEITVFDPSLLMDVGIAYNWRQRMPPERFEEMLAGEKQCYPPVNWKKLMETVGSHLPGDEWEMIPNPCISQSADTTDSPPAMTTGPESAQTQ